MKITLRQITKIKNISNENKTPAISETKVDNLDQ